MLAFRSSTVLFILAGVLSTLPIHAGSIPITNPGFQTVANVTGCSAGNTLFANQFISTTNLGSGCQSADPFNGTWSVTGDVGVWFPSTGSPYPSGAPSGTNVGFLDSGSISQILSSTVALGTYTLGVYIGGRCDIPINNYMVQLLAGGSTVIASDSNSLVPSLTGSGCGTFMHDTLTGTVSNGALVGENLKIVLSATGSNDTTQTAAASIVIDFQELPPSVPEPATWVLTALGVGVLLRLSSWGAAPRGR